MKFADTLVTTCYFNSSDRPVDLDTNDLVYITLGTKEENNSKEIIWKVTAESKIKSLCNLEIKKKTIAGQLDVDNINNVSVWASFDSFESQFRVPCFYFVENNVNTVNFEVGLDMNYQRLSLKITHQSTEELNIHYKVLQSPSQNLHERRKIRKEGLKIKTDHHIPLSLVPSFLEREDYEIWVPTAISTATNLFHFTDDDFHVPSPSITSGLLSVSPVHSFSSIFA
ncbi:hypothetical protein HDV01_000905 [Terramyces sp. JEL0728]|nr:hypothetical protein HDV01_000905 [Terramyces sp. JEL0728]